MVNFLSPGVKVVEIDLSALIPQVSTNITAYVGRFEKGPVNAPTLVTNPNTLETVFGKVTQDNVLDWMTARNFFANGFGDKLYLVRTVNEDGLKTSATGSIGSGDTTIPCSSTSQFPTSGKLRINDSEVVTYVGKTAVSFQNVTRGLAGTTAAAYTGGEDIALLPENSSLAISNSAAPFVAGTGATGTITFPALSVLAEGDSVTVVDDEGTSLTLELDKDGSGPTITGAIPVNTAGEPDDSTVVSASRPFEVLINGLYTIEVVDATNFTVCPTVSATAGSYDDVSDAHAAVANSVITAASGAEGIVRYKVGNTLYVQMVSGTFSPGEGVDNVDTYAATDTLVVSFNKMTKITASDVGNDGTVELVNASLTADANQTIVVTTAVPGSITATGMSGGTDPENYRDDFITHYNIELDIENTPTFSDKEVIKVYAKSPGKWGQNVSVSVCSATNFDTAYVLGNESQGLTFNGAFDFEPDADNQEIALAVFLKDAQGNQELVERYIVSLDALAKDKAGLPNFAEDVINRQSPYINILVNPNTSGTAILEAILSSGINESATTIPVLSTTGFPDAGRIRIGNEFITYTGLTATTFTGATRGADGSTAATHASGAIVTEANTVATITNVSLTGGSDAINTREDIKDEILSGYDLFANPEKISVDLFIDGANCNDSTIQKYILQQVVEKRRDCMGIFSPPWTAMNYPLQTQVISALGDWRRGRGSFIGSSLETSSSYGAIFANWKLEYVRELNKDYWIPLSGSEAGIFARTDATTEPWYAPAGFVRGRLDGVERLKIYPDLGERDILYKDQLNPIADIYGSGPINWGQKTMQNFASNFDRINVRRLFLVLEKAIAAFARPFVFEFNDRYTRTMFVSAIRPYLRDIQGRRGIEDFLVICDESNNPPEVRDRQELVCDIFIKPTKVAEFIRLNFITTKLGASFEEFLTAA